MTKKFECLAKVCLLALSEELVATSAATAGESTAEGAAREHAMDANCIHDVRTIFARVMLKMSWPAWSSSKHAIVHASHHPRCCLGTEAPICAEIARENMPFSVFLTL
jgi:hypothetical protein